MSAASSLSRAVIAGIKPVAKRLYGRVAHLAPAGLKTRIKHRRELDFWRSQVDPATFDRAGHDAYYRQLMLQIAGESDPSFVADKVLVDFGCGPMGSLCWARQARERIGVDVLADAYRRLGVPAHAMRYATSTETSIPLPSHTADILFTVNALDHVTHLEQMCAELLRILKPGGELIASLNMGEPPTLAEPQTLTEDRIDRYLLAGLDVVAYRVAAQAPPPASPYAHFFDGSPPATSGPRYLWVRARKRTA